MDSLNSQNDGLEEKQSMKALSLKSHDNRDDGGYGWVIVASTFMAYSLMSFHLLTFGIFAPEFATDFSLSESEVGYIASLRFGLFSFTGIFAGPLVQRFGCRPVAMAAVFMSTFANVATAFAKDFITIALTYGFIAGLGTGMIVIPSIVIVQQYFTRRRAIAAGLSSVGLAIFAVVASPLARFLVDTFGWRGASILFGGFSLQMLVPTALYKPFKVQKISLVTETESKANKLSWKRRIDLFTSYFFNKDLLRCYFILFLVTSTTRTALLDTYINRMVLVGQSVGINSKKAAVLPSIAIALVALGRGLSGFLARWVPPHILFGIFNILSALVLFAVPLLPNTFLAHIICASTFGFCVGSFLGIQNTTLANLVGIDVLPLALTWDCLVVGIFQMTSNVIVGKLLDETGTYRIPLWYGATVHFCGSLGALAIIVLKWREKRKIKTDMENSPVQISFNKSDN